MNATPLVTGRAGGPALLLDAPLSLWGGLDPETGRIIDVHHPQVGEIVTGRVVVMDAGRGSSSASSVLAEAIRLGTAPAAMILERADGILVIGSLVAEFIGVEPMPIVVVPEPVGGDFIVVDGAAIHTITIEEVPAAEVIDLRHSVLRHGMSRESAIFDGDNAADTTHLAARLVDGSIIGVASSMAQARDEATRRIRGMAVEPEWRDVGLGAALLRALLDAHAEDRHWCNARTGAVSLYRRNGFETVGDVFETEVGPHVTMLETQ